MEGHSIEGRELPEHMPRRYLREQAAALSDEEFERMHVLADAIANGEITHDDPRYDEWLQLDKTVHGKH